jgi:hypothetical protein
MDEYRVGAVQLDCDDDFWDWPACPVLIQMEHGEAPDCALWTSFGPVIVQASQAAFAVEFGRRVGDPTVFTSGGEELSLVLERAEEALAGEAGGVRAFDRYIPRPRPYLGWMGDGFKWHSYLQDSA